MPTSDPRRTGLIARVVDTNLNGWEDFTGVDINPLAFYQPVDTTGYDDTNLDYWAYRGQSSVVLLGNGNIVRVRIGTPNDNTDRDVWIQTITDPTNPSQWLTWTAKGWGTNYAIALERDDGVGKGYRLYHSKANGLFMDNVSIVADATGPPITRIKPVYGKTNALYYQVLSTAQDGHRTQNWSYLQDTTSVLALPDIGQYDAYHEDLVALRYSVYLYRLRARPMGGQERNVNASDVLTVETGLSSFFNITDGESLQTRYLKGPSRKNGFTRIENMYGTQIADAEFSAGMWYLFYTEQHLDAYGNVLSNLKAPLFWSRCAVSPTTGNPFYWSESMPVGYSVWGFGGIAVTGGYVYATGNGRVLRRPLQPTSIDITDYIGSGRYAIPRDNGKATGTLIAANPKNVLGAQLGLSSSTATGGLTERKLEFGIGIKRPNDVSYTFKRDAQWWIAQLQGTKDDEGKENLSITIEDFWHRMSSPFKDDWYQPGHFEWDDWQPDAQNRLENYSNTTDELVAFTGSGGEDASSLPRLTVTASGNNTDLNNILGGGTNGGSITIFTGLPPVLNSVTSVRNWSASGLGVVFRYVDVNNFMLARFLPNGVFIEQIEAGDARRLVSYTDLPVAVGSVCELIVNWRQITPIVDGLEHTLTMDNARPTAGFVGLHAPPPGMSISNFSVDELNAELTAWEQVRLLLAYAGEHDVEFENLTDENSGEIMQTWGPQSDLNTPEKALRSVLESSKLNITYRQDT